MCSLYKTCLKCKGILDSSFVDHPVSLKYARNNCSYLYELCLPNFNMQ